MTRAPTPQQIQERERLMKIIGGAVRTARERLDLSQADVAKRLGVTVQHYSSIDRGQSLPGLVKLCRLADALETSVSELLGNPAGVLATGNSTHLMDCAGTGGVADECPELSGVLAWLGKASPDTLDTVSWLLDTLDRIAAERAERADKDG